MPHPNSPLLPSTCAGIPNAHDLTLGLRLDNRLGATAAVTPQHAAELAPFDISLEVTGSPRGLQVGGETLRVACS